MIAEELWKPKKVRKVAIHQMRERRACFGELVQIDGSPHDWFEGRAPACTLLVFIDDATGKLGHLQLVESESFFSYAQATAVYFNRYDKPVAFYSDKHSVFRVNQPSVGSEHDVSQFGRAMHGLDIEIICANTPQAKGRVERAIQTLQDRLPKELRLRGISSWKTGNAYLPEFIQHFNQRFSVSPRSDHDAHRPLTARDPLDTISKSGVSGPDPTSQLCPAPRRGHRVFECPGTGHPPLPRQSSALHHFSSPGTSMGNSERSGELSTTPPPRRQR